MGDHRNDQADPQNEREDEDTLADHKLEHFVVELVGEALSDDVNQVAEHHQAHASCQEEKHYRSRAVQRALRLNVLGLHDRGHSADNGS